VKAGCRNDEIGLREGVSGFAAFFQQNPPPEHDVFGNRQNSLLEHGAYRKRQPVFQFVPAGSFAQQFDAESELSERYSTDIKLMEWIAGNKRQHLWLWFQASNFGEDVGIEEPRH
jgi:hypothetical protein